MTADALIARGAIAWSIVTAVLNVILRTATPEQWIERCERSPRFAAFTKLLRRYGVNPVGTVEQIQRLVSGAAK
jgi:hypothetical protein